MHKFNYDWFTGNLQFWQILIDKTKPKRILEIGSFEGMSTCAIIDMCTKFHPIELYCVDTWAGSGDEHEGIDFAQVESTFHHNVNCSMGEAKNPITLHKIKETSLRGLSLLIARNVPKFDLIYVDGSHTSSDVLVDACLSFNLLNVGGLLIFDDYLWAGWNEMKEDKVVNDVLHQMKHPMPAIDAFMHIFKGKVGKCIFNNDPSIITYQMYLSKISE